MSDIENDMLMRTLRLQAWERAKGELRSMLQTFWLRDSGGQSGELESALVLFIAHVEDNALQE